MDAPLPAAILEQIKALDVQQQTDGRYVLSRTELISIILKLNAVIIYPEFDNVPEACLVLVDRNSREFHLFNTEALPVWSRDGSFEKGDRLYQMNLLKEF